MADLSKIKIPNGTEYNLKDAQARADIESLNGSLVDVKADLKSALKITGADVAVTLTSTWEKGVIYPTSGTDSTNNNRIRCKPIVTPEGKITLTVDSGYQVYLYVYPDGTFDASYNNGWKTGTFTADVPYGYIRLCVANTAGTEADVSYASHLTISFKANMALHKDQIMKYFDGSGYSSSNKFSVANMPSFSYAYVVANIFNNAPTDVAETDTIYITKVRIGASDWSTLVSIYVTNTHKWYYGLFTNNVLSGSWNKAPTRKEILKYFDTGAYSSSNKFSVSNIPDNSFTLCMSNIFANTPASITETHTIYISRQDMGASAYNSLVRVYDKETGIWYSACFVNNVLYDTWHKDTGYTNNYKNNYNFTTNQNTYNVTASPEITTDTNNYLAPSGDTTDRTSDIETLLATGCCHLGPGDYYVTGIDMPVNAELVGSGWKTRIIVANSVTSGYGVKLETNSIVRDLRICTSSSAVLPESIGNVHGIVYASTRTPSDNTPSVLLHATISNVFIHGFVGGGITCYGTGLGYDASLNVDNVCIYNCFAGINNSYYSEFHRFTNCNVWGCVYGAIVNGGNNVFANCGFNGNKTNMLFDNEFSQSPNNTHGAVIGCTIHHSNYNNNDGQNIVLKGTQNGEVFNGCQISHGSIVIDKAKGITFTGCNMLTYTPINVTDSKAVIFNGCVITADANSPVTQSGNTGLKFINSMTFEGVDYNPLV